MHRSIQLTAICAGIGGVAMLAGCAAVPPSGPTVMALPGQGKTFETFQQDDFTCRGFAQQQTGFQQPGQAATNAAVGSAVIGTALGAAAGAAIGAATGNPAAGAAIGGATGLVGGTAVGANNATAAEYSLQQRYNIAYTQCMYARGNTVQSPPPAYAGYSAPGFGYAPGVWAPSVSFSVGPSWGWGPGWGWGGGWGGWGWGRGWGCCGGGWGRGWHGGWHRW